MHLETERNALPKIETFGPQITGIRRYRGRVERATKIRTIDKTGARDEFTMLGGPGLRVR